MARKKKKRGVGKGWWGQPRRHSEAAKKDGEREKLD